MADPTYNNQAIYRKQGGNEFVVADGGAITQESGSKQVLETGSELEVQSGSTFDVQTGAGFTYVDTLVTADILKLMFLSPHTVTQWGSASITGTIAPAYGFHVFEAGTTVSLLSMTIPAASKGAQLYLDGKYVAGDGNISLLTVSATGKVINQRGSDLSSLELSAVGFLKMNCVADATWTVVEVSEINEHASS